MKPSSNAKIDERISDYLNGNLSSFDKAAFEKAANSDESLMASLAFEQRIRASVRHTSQDVPAANFQTLQKRLDTAQPTQQKQSLLPDISWLSIGKPVAITFMLLATVFITKLFLNDAANNTSGGNNTFVTLSNSPEPSSDGAIRIVLSNKLNSDEQSTLLSEYGLTALRHYPNANALDVIAAVETDGPSLLNGLSQDKRVLLAKQLENSTP